MRSKVGRLISFDIYSIMSFREGERSALRPSSLASEGRYQAIGEIRFPGRSFKMGDLESQALKSIATIPPKATGQYESCDFSRRYYLLSCELFYLHLED